MPPTLSPEVLQQSGEPTPDLIVPAVIKRAKSLSDEDRSEKTLSRDADNELEFHPKEFSDCNRRDSGVSEDNIESSDESRASSGSLKMQESEGKRNDEQERKGLIVGMRTPPSTPTQLPVVTSEECKLSQESLNATLQSHRLLCEDTMQRTISVSSLPDELGSTKSRKTKKRVSIVPP